MRNTYFLKSLRASLLAVGVTFGAVCVTAMLDAPRVHAATSQLDQPTHRQVRTIVPKIDGKPVALHTLTTNPDGLIIAGVGGRSMTYQTLEDGGLKPVSSEQPAAVLLLDSMGETVKQIDVEFTPTAVTVSPDGTIYAGGSGKIVQISADGEVLASIDSPHAGDQEAMRKEAIKSIKRQRKMMAEMYSSQVETLEEQIDAIKEKDEDDRSRLENARLEAFEEQLEMFKGMMGGDPDGEPTDEEIESAIEQSLKITSMAASNEDLFICASLPMAGFKVWRVDGDLKSVDGDAKVVLDSLSGCCGQMDIQCCEDVLVVSENTRFKVGMYDRDGERLSSFGGRDRTSKKGFGSCCNPMNSLPLQDGSILTAESSIGHIKRFDQDGELIAYIGKAKIGGGCKHCSLGYDEKNDLYYMQYQDENAICVLANVQSTPLSASEKELLAKQDAFFGKLAGTWTNVKAKDQPKENNGIVAALFGGGRGTDSNLPISAMEVQSDGSAKILGGMYAAYGDSSQFMVKQSDGDNSADGVPFGLAVDQVEFMTGNWRFVDEQTAEITLVGMPKMTMKRKVEACPNACDSDGESGDSDCEKSKQKLASTSVAADADADADAVAAELTEMEADSEMEVVEQELDTYEIETFQGDPITYQYEAFMPKQVISYKLLSAADLGKNKEDSLNKLGKEGWDFCGKLGKKLMFKKVDLQMPSTESMEEVVDALRAGNDQEGEE